MLLYLHMVFHFDIFQQVNKQYFPTTGYSRFIYFQSIQVSPFWPTMGVVSFKNVRLRYRSDLSDALKGVTFCTKPTEKVGIVGRTGSGKSSLFQALFRITEIHQGDIKVDGNSIKYLDLKEIRYCILKFLSVNCRLMIVNCQWVFFPAISTEKHNGCCLYQFLFTFKGHICLLSNLSLCHCYYKSDSSWKNMSQKIYFC